MKTLLIPLSLLVLLAGAVPAFAQVSTRPTDAFAWDQDGPSQVVVQAYRYELELDGVVATTPLMATCSGLVMPFLCTAPIPAVTPTTHAIRLRAVDVSVPATPIAGGWSDVFSFLMRAIPATPRAVRIVPGA
jgi:hypothetical protein